jgi:hypothetical protein
MALKYRGKTLAAGLLAGALLGGGLAAITPAGAAVQGAAAAIDWKQVWKQEIKPRADKRYYTKKKSNARYYAKWDANALFETKAAHDASLAGYYTKAQSDANYYTKAQSDANYYTKTQSDAKYTSQANTVRGIFSLIGYTATGQIVTDDISFGVTLSAAPAFTVIPVGGPPTAACPGTLLAPTALPGNLCLYLRYTDAAAFSVLSANNSAGPSPFGAHLVATNDASAYLEVNGSWAVKPVALAPASKPVPASSGAAHAGPTAN